MYYFVLFCLINEPPHINSTLKRKDTRVNRYFLIFERVFKLKKKAPQESGFEKAQYSTPLSITYHTV